MTTAIQSKILSSSAESRFGRLWRILVRMPVEAIHWIKATRRRQLFKKLFEDNQNLVRRSLYPSETGITVLTGPFRGLRYLDETVFGSITPKWLGSYEFEIQDIIEDIIQRQYRQIINVGCAEGYYAVGLAWRTLNSRVFAFDNDPLSRMQARRLAAINALTNRLTVHDLCTHADLQRLAVSHSLVLVDIEGGEMDLLDPSKVPGLRQADILVEVHETTPKGADVGSLVQSRFDISHTIERRILSDRSDWIQLNKRMWHCHLALEEVQNATNEFRTTQQSWLWMQARRATIRCD